MLGIQSNRNIDLLPELNAAYGLTRVKNAKGVPEDIINNEIREVYKKYIGESRKTLKSGVQVFLTYFSNLRFLCLHWIL